MSIVVIPSAGLIGSKATTGSVQQGCEVVGIKNDSRGVFLGENASTVWHRQHLVKPLRAKYPQVKDDLTDDETINEILKPHGFNWVLIINGTAQPLGEAPVCNAVTVFETNVNSKLNLLEATRSYNWETTSSIDVTGRDLCQ